MYPLLPLLILSLQQTAQLTIDVDNPTHPVSPTFYGLMTEEINHSYDGGLYAELIQNRALKDTPDLAHWSAVGEANIALDSISIPNTALTKCLKLIVESKGGVSNDGYWGIPVKPNTGYTVSFWAKAEPPQLRASQAFDSEPSLPVRSSPTSLAEEGDLGSAATNISLRSPDSNQSKVILNVCLETADGQTVEAQATTGPITQTWAKYTAILQTKELAPSSNNRFAIRTNAPATLWLTQVSLTAPTYKDRKNGNRKNRMEMLKAMHPTFLRLPGGNYLEGDTVKERFDWKATLHDIDQRPGHQGPWGYRSSDGLGLVEFLDWCEDLHMQPVLGVYAGWSFKEHVAPGSDLQPFVQDALDEIEYITGDTATKWGKVRAQDGHPKPFPLTYVEIGNEDPPETYNARFEQFYDAIKKRYPKLKLIATNDVQSRKPDLMDDHYYRSATAMEGDANHYDDYNRKGPKIFVGEWATTEGEPTPNWDASLADAAWLTGLERNSDVVLMEAYAPLLVNVNPGAKQWGTNLIGYDALNSFGSPSYWVQCLFAQNTGDNSLPFKLELNEPPKPKIVYHGGIGLGTYDTHCEYKDLQITQAGKVIYDKNFSQGAPDWTPKKGTWDIDGDAFRQTSSALDARTVIGDPSWTNYEIHLKAKKLSGKEGFLILFHMADDQNFWQWNVGGWGNELTTLQKFTDGSGETVGPGTQMKVETGRWYDIRIELKDGGIKCYLDGKLVTEMTPSQVAAANKTPKPIYVAASASKDGKEVFLKVVNVTAEAKTINLNLTAGTWSPNAEVWQMQGDPKDTNSLADPKKVAPVALKLSDVSQIFTHEFPAHSVTVIRLHRQ